MTSPLRMPVLVALVGSRLVVLLAAFLAEALPGRNAALTSGDGGPILRSLTSWDGWWYLGIARDGYHAAPLVGDYHDYAFLPLYPALVRLLSVPWPDLAGLVAVVVSNLLFASGLLLLTQLGRTTLRDDRADRAAALLAVSPFSAAFSMAYTESLFLVVSVGSFLALERDRRALGAVLLGLAALTRLQGAVLIVPLWTLLFLRDQRRIRFSQAWLLLGPAAALAFMAFVTTLTGDTAAYGGAQAGWGRIGVSLTPAGGSIAGALSPYQAVLLLTLVVAVFLLVYLRPDRIPLPYGMVPVLYLGLELYSGILEAVGRIVTLAFPNFWLLAGRRGRWFRIGWPIVSVALLFVLSLQMFRGYFVP